MFCKPGTIRIITKQNGRLTTKCLSIPKTKKSKNRKIPKLNKGTLRSFGYSTSKTAQARHLALNKGVKKLGYQVIIHKLNAVRVLTNKSNPRVSKIFEQDMDYLQKRY